MSRANPQELSAIQATVLALEKQIHDLQDQKTQFLQRLNNLQSLTTIFPPEILSAVFCYACDGNASEGSVLPIKLGAICSEWRHVAWTTPQLWTHFELCLANITPSAYSTLLQLYLRNAGDLSLSINLNFEFKHVPCADSKKILEMIFTDCAAKLGSFQCEFLTRNWWHCIEPYAQRIEFPRLRNVNLSWYGFLSSSSDPGTAIFRSPLLNRVQLWATSSTDLPGRFAWSQITSLVVSGFCVEHTLDLLSQCPHLVNLEFRGKHVSTTTTAPSLAQRVIIVMKYLQVLSWSGCSLDNDESFLTTVRLPALRELHWQEALPPRHQHIIIPFLENSPQLRKLYLSTLPSFPDLPLLWQVLSKVEELTVGNLAVDEVVKLLHSLILRPNPNGSNSDEFNSKCLANLGSLQIRCYGVMVPAFQPAILEFLTSRCKALHFNHQNHDLVPLSISTTHGRWNWRKNSILEYFGLSLLGVFMGWENDLVELSKDLRREGIRLEIIENGRMVPWMLNETLWYVNQCFS